MEASAVPDSSAPAPDAATSCSAFVPCGGDVVGTWVIDRACVLSVPPISGCAQGIETVSMSVSGTVSFSADGTVAADTTLALQKELVLPASCLAGTDCASMQTALLSQSGIVSASCVGDTTSALCTCNEAFAPGRNTKSDPFTIAGTTLMSPGAYPEPYCVQGRTLQWQDQSADGLVFVVTAAK